MREMNIDLHTTARKDTAFIEREGHEGNEINERSSRDARFCLRRPPAARAFWNTHFNAKDRFAPFFGIRSKRGSKGNVNGARLAGATSAECGHGFRLHL